MRGVSVVKVFGQTIHSFKSFFNAIMTYKKFVSEYALSCEKPMTAFTTVVNSTFFFLIPAGILISRFTANNETFLLALLFYILFTPACAVLLNKLMRIVAGADRLVVLQNGKVVQDGAPAELPGQPGLYQRMVTLRRQSAGWKAKSAL